MFNEIHPNHLTRLFKNYFKRPKRVTKSSSFAIFPRGPKSFIKYLDQKKNK